SSRRSTASRLSAHSRRRRSASCSSVSRAAGILDGGVSEVSLGGSRLSRFMKDIEKVTGRTDDGDAGVEVMTLAEEHPAIALIAAEPVSGTSDQVVEMEGLEATGADGAGSDKAEPQEAR